jgi:hypothetical protein
LKNWGYAPVGDHSVDHRLNMEGFLVWEKIDPKTQTKKYFVISNPRWRAHRFNEPVWPANIITRALRAQEIYHRFGSEETDLDGFVPLSKKPHLKTIK